MSYTSLITASQDQALTERTTAAVMQEAWNNPTLSQTDYAASVRGYGGPLDEMHWPVSVLLWPVVLNTEAEYASALAAGIPDPGADESVISDPMILSAVQASWPDTWPPPATP